MSRAESESSRPGYSCSGHEACNADYYMDDEAGSNAERLSSEESPNWTTGIIELPYKLVELMFISAYQSALDRPAMSQCLSQVCKSWRHVAMSTPILWTTINILVGELGVQEHLQRSGSTLLDVRIFLPHTICENEGEARIARFSNILGSYCNRIQNVTLHAYYATWISASSKLLGNPSAQLKLESFDLRLLQYTPEAVNDGPDADTVCNRLSCQVKHLQVEGFAVSNIRFFTQSLKSLKLTWLPHDCRFDVFHLATQYLASSPNLEYLHLTYATNASHGTTPQREVVVHLPQLKEIILEGVTPDTVQWLFSCITTPRLRALLIDIKGKQNSIGWALEDLTRQSPLIRQLHVKSGKIDCVSFWNVLENLPLLTDLRFTLCDIPWGILAAKGLAYNAYSKTPTCPNLISLTLEYDLNITDGDLIKLVESRLTTNERISPISSITCRAPLSPDFIPDGFVYGLHNKVPKLTLEILGELKRSRASRASVEEEWIGLDERPDLDSGDEEVIRQGGEFVGEKTCLRWKADYVRSDRILRDWYHSESLWREVVANKRLQEENGVGPPNVAN